MTTKYALPPLPEPLCNLPTYCQDVIRQYTRAVLDDHLNDQDAAIEADRKRRGEPLEGGWRLIAVNEVWDALELVMNRACSKGYMPDAIGEKWDAFDWTEAPQPAEPSRGEPYNPRTPTEEEWSRLTENGRKAWGKKDTESTKDWWATMLAAAPKFGEEE